MKTNLSRMLTIIVMICGMMPLVTTAQNSDREFYQRPSYWRPYDQRGLNVFETSKMPDSIPFQGLRTRFGAGFTQNFQSLKHSNTADDKLGANKLYALTSGFNTAMANLNMD